MFHFDVKYKVLSLFARNKVLVITEIFRMVQRFRGAANNTKEKLSMKNKNWHKEMKTKEELSVLLRKLGNGLSTAVSTTSLPGFSLSHRRKGSWEGSCCFYVIIVFQWKILRGQTITILCSFKTLLLVEVLHKTWNQAFSRRSGAVTAKKCTKKLCCTCRVVVLLIEPNALFDVLVAVAVLAC